MSQIWYIYTIYNYIHLVGLEKALFSEKQSSSHRIGNDHVAKERKRERENKSSEKN